MSDQHPVDLFGERRVSAAAAQPGLHVSDGNFAQAGRQRRGEGAGSISLDKDERRLELLEHLLAGGDDPGCQGSQRLAGHHQVQIKIRPQPEELQEWVEQFPVLSGHAQPGVEGRVRLEGADHRGHFDGLRTGTQREQNRLPVDSMHGGSP